VKEREIDSMRVRERVKEREVDSKSERERVKEKEVDSKSERERERERERELNSCSLDAVHCTMWSYMPKSTLFYFVTILVKTNGTFEIWSCGSCEMEISILGLEKDHKHC
jgi:hypothetical protein